MKKLENVNGHYLRAADDMRLTALAAPLVEAAIARALDPAEQDLLLRTMPHLKVRARTLNELAESALFLFRTRPIQLDEKAKGLLDSDGVDRLAAARDVIAAVDEWTAPAFEAALRATAEQSGVGLGKFAQPLRAALTGSTTSPGIFEVLEVLGRDESLGRMDDQLNNVAASAAK